MQRSQTKSKIKKSVPSDKAPVLGLNWLEVELERWTKECCSRTSQAYASLKTGRADDDDERSDKILEVDTWKPHQLSSRLLRTPQHAPQCHKNLSVSSAEPLSFRSLKLPGGGQVSSASSCRPGSSGRRRGLFSPARSEFSRAFHGDYLAYPNFMANTESYLAKVRSQSAPRERSQPEKLGRKRG